MFRVGRCGGLLMLLVLAGCTKPEDYLKVAREQRTAYKELADILVTIEDEKSMAAATAALADRSAKCEAIARTGQALPQPPPPEVQERFQEDAFVMKRTIERMQEEVRRVRGLKGGPEFFKQFESKHPSLFPAVQP
jgi:hypothetical protein